MQEIIPVPKLDIDKILYPPDGSCISARGLIERAVVFALLLHLERAGFTAESVCDGEETTPTKTLQEVMELCFNLDDARIYFQKDGKDVGSALLIFGNDGWDTVSDWSWNENDFDAAMDAFKPEEVVVLGVVGVKKAILKIANGKEKA